jgi:hypothetical protein
MWRQGDVFIAPVRTIPRGARLRPGGVLVEGELTGHSHRVADLRTAEVLQDGDQLFLRVLADAATIVHQEHGPISLSRGTYRVWGQREYSPEAIRRVLD